LVAVPEPKAAGLCVLVLKLPDHPAAVTVLNFGREEVTEEVDLGEAAEAGGRWLDILSGRPVAGGNGRKLMVRLPALTGTTLVLSPER
jgi:hypothetical protein